MLALCQMLKQQVRGRLRGKLGFLLRLSFSAVLVTIVLLFVDFGELRDVLVEANWWFLAVAIAFLYTDRWLMAYKWNPLLSAVNVSVPFMALVRTYMVSPIAQMFLPSTVGADLFRLYALSRYKVDREAVLASMIVERLLGFVATLLLVLLSFGVAFFVLKDSWSPIAKIGWILLLIGFLLGVLVIAALLAIHPLSKMISNHASESGVVSRFLSKLQRVFTMSAEFRNRRKILLTAFLWTFFEQFLLIFMVYFTARALNIDVSLLFMLAILPLTILAIRLPISLDGIGVQEGLYVALFTLAGVSPSEALLLSVARRGIMAACALPWGIYYVTHRQAKSALEPLETVARAE